MHPTKGGKREIKGGIPLRFFLSESQRQEEQKTQGEKIREEKGSKFFHPLTRRNNRKGKKKVVTKVPV